MRSVFVASFFFLLAATPARAGDKIKVEFSRGFDTLAPAEQFPAYWKSRKDRHKMRGKVSDHLTRHQIDSIIMLEMNIAIAADPRSPSLQNELLCFMTENRRFETGPLPDRFTNNPEKQLVAVFRTDAGDYGLITLYRDFAVLELNGLVGVVPRPGR